MNPDPPETKPPVQWHLRNREDEPDTSWPMRVLAFVCFEILAAVVCALVFGFGPMYLAFDQNRHTTSYERKQQDAELNWAAAHFQRNMYLGTGFGLIGGAVLWWRVTRKGGIEEL